MRGEQASHFHLHNFTINIAEIGICHWSCKTLYVNPMPYFVQNSMGVFNVCAMEIRMPVMLEIALV
jgi:hypothetical protein